jgi:hypothetical protein
MRALISLAAVAFAANNTTIAAVAKNNITAAGAKKNTTTATIAKKTPSTLTRVVPIKRTTVAKQEAKSAKAKKPQSCKMMSTAHGLYNLKGLKKSQTDYWLTDDSNNYFFNFCGQDLEKDRCQNDVSGTDIVRSKKSDPYICEKVGEKIETVQDIENGVRLNYKMG